MFFTHCEYACPIIVNDMRKLQAALPEDVRGKVDFLLVSFDAKRDTPETLAAEGADFADRRFGEDVFLLDPGVLMVPSYMGRAPLASMHGYDPAHPDMAGILASNRPLPADVTHLAHLRGHLERLLDALATPAASGPEAA